MDVLLRLEDGTIVTRAELGMTNIDVLTMQFTIPVELYTAAGDKVYTLEVVQTLEALPIPTVEEQWALVLPALNAYQSTHPAP